MGKTYTRAERIAMGPQGREAVRQERRKAQAERERCQFDLMLTLEMGGVCSTLEEFLASGI
jgi:hypothetical protein